MAAVRYHNIIDNYNSSIGTFDDIPKDVEYIVVIDKLNNKIYNYNKVKNFTNTYKYIDKEDYIRDNNVITYFLNDTINKYLYDVILSENVYNNLKEINDLLALKVIKYDEINNIIKQNIDNALNKIHELLQSKRGINTFYFHLKYNSSTYYPYIEEIKNYIKRTIAHKFNFTYIND